MGRRRESRLNPSYWRLWRLDAFGR